MATRAYAPETIEHSVSGYMFAAVLERAQVLSDSCFDGVRARGGSDLDKRRSASEVVGRYAPSWRSDNCAERRHAIQRTCH